MPSAHPRSRGENPHNLSNFFGAKGSSPLTRGKQAIGINGVDDEGLIPAHAGKTQSWWGRRGPPRAHPRSRGENLKAEEEIVHVSGSSPLTRGKHHQRSEAAARMGLIPAHAGKTRTSRLYSYTVRAHPRSRGENPRGGRASLPAAGSSPLTRGKPAVPKTPEPKPGLIPAHAGKTKVRRHLEIRGQAHPRSRGENQLRNSPKSSREGSSPLTRGKRSR